MSPATFQLIMDWVPFVIFMALLLFVARKMKPQQQAQRDYMREQLVSLQRTNDLLERIAVSLEKGHQ